MLKVKMKAQLKVVNEKPAQAIETWFANFSNHDNGDYRLICFPFSGGGANIYRQWPVASAPATDGSVGVEATGSGGQVLRAGDNRPCSVG